MLEHTVPPPKKKLFVVLLHLAMSPLCLRKCKKASTAAFYFVNLKKYFLIINTSSELFKVQRKDTFVFML